MVKGNLHTIIAFATLSFASSAQAAVMTFTDRAEWAAALSGASFSTEEFEGIETNFAANSTGNAVGFVNIDVLGNGDSTPQGLNGSGLLEFELDSDDRVTDDGLSLSLSFNLANDVWGFALTNIQNQESPAGSYAPFEFGIQIGTFGTRLDRALGTGTLQSAPTPFLGFVSDAATGPITSFDIVHGDLIDGPVPGGAQGFAVDSLIVATTASTPSSIAEPATASLIAAGLTGLITAARRRHQARVCRDPRRQGLSRASFDGVSG